MSNTRVRVERLTDAVEAEVAARARVMVAAMIERLSRIVREHVKDPEVLRLIADDLRLAAEAWEGGCS